MIAELVKNVGFPIAISIYFIFKIEKTVENNTKALIKVANVMKKCRRRE